MMTRAVLLIFCLLAAAPAAAQEDTVALGVERIGSFETESVVDSAWNDLSWASTLAVRGDSTYLVWYCDGYSLFIDLQHRDAATGTTLTWRFDDEAPRSSTVEIGEDSTYYWGHSLEIPTLENRAFTRRARSAGRMVARFSASNRMREVEFDLDGADAALQKLPCVQALEPPGAGEWALGGEEPWLLEPDSNRFQRSPEVINQDEVTAAMTERFPEELNARGGKVVLAVRVLADGTPDVEASRIQFSTHAALTRAAIEVIPLLRFNPGTRFGRAAAGFVTLPLVFLPEP